MKPALMYTRRMILCSLATITGSVLLSRRVWPQNAKDNAERNEKDFVCSAKEASANKPKIINYSSNEIIKESRITSYGTAFLHQRWRRDDGRTPSAGIITLGCYFLNGTEKNKDKVKNAATGWLHSALGKLITFDFGVTQDNADIRILFDFHGLNDSTIGRDALSIQDHAQPTMHISLLTDFVIQHEFGHALGLRHEHLHPEAAFEFKEDVVIQEMRGRGWDETAVRLNILEREKSPEARCIGEPTFNKDSIMIYPIPPHWTKNGASFEPSSTITARDIQCLVGLYSV